MLYYISQSSQRLFCDEQRSVKFSFLIPKGPLRDFNFAQVYSCVVRALRKLKEISTVYLIRIWFENYESHGGRFLFGTKTCCSRHIVKHGLDWTGMDL